MANVPVSGCLPFLGQEVIAPSFRMTGETCVNPALGVAHQLFSSIIDSTNAKPQMILILLFPSLIGGAIAGFVMRQFYEPMLLYTRFKHEL